MNFDNRVPQQSGRALGSVKDQMNASEFAKIVEIAKEGRHIEFKCSMSWADASFRAKLIKSVLAFSNVRDGGRIIIGVDQHDDTFDFVGVSADDLGTYDEDTITANVAEYADPYVRLALERVRYDDNDYIVIRVMEFEDVPVICRKDGLSNLRRGAIYTRTHRMPESAEVPSQTELREILDIAVEKKIREYHERQARVGAPGYAEPDHGRRFDDELGDLQ